MATPNDHSSDDKTEKRLQGAVIINCSNCDTQELITKTRPEGNWPPAQLHAFGNIDIRIYPWSFENKYYSTEIFLFELCEKNIVGSQFAECVEAVIVFFESSEANSFELVKSWMPFIEAFSPEIKMLVCESISETSDIPRRTVQEWCLKNEFELIEFNPEVVSDDESVEDDFQETTGSLRIFQALQAHEWPDMQLKELPIYKPSEKFQDLLQTSSETSNASQERLAEVEEFDDLFSKLSEIKMSASNLSGEERLEYAENVAKAFWKALGGDDKEINFDSS